jgi:enoyl-[acyl-carrier-protein] reductase (NADH)
LRRDRHGRIDAVFDGIEKKWGKLDFVVHAIGFSDKDELTGRYVDTSHATTSCAPWTFRSIPSRPSPSGPSG